MWEKTIAAALIMCGSWGFGYALCQEQRCLQYHLTQQKQLLFYIIGEISYLNRPMGELLGCISGRLREPYAGFADRMAERMDKEGGRGLTALWQEETERLLTVRAYPREATLQLQRIGECFGCEEGTQQIAALRQLCAQLEERIGELKGRRAEKDRLIQSLSLLAGVFCVVLFL